MPGAVAGSRSWRRCRRAPSSHPPALRMHRSVPWPARLRVVCRRRRLLRRVRVRRGLLDAHPGGTPGQASSAELPIDAAANPNAVVDTVACVSVGSCVATNIHGRHSADRGLRVQPADSPVCLDLEHAEGAPGGRVQTDAHGERRLGLVHLVCLLRASATRVEPERRDRPHLGQAKTVRSYRFTVHVSGTGSPAQVASRTLSIAVAGPAFTVSVAPAG